MKSSFKIGVAQISLAAGGAASPQILGDAAPPAPWPIRLCERKLETKTY